MSDVSYQFHKEKKIISFKKLKNSSLDCQTMSESELELILKVLHKAGLLSTHPYKIGKKKGLIDYSIA